MALFIVRFGHKKRAVTVNLQEAGIGEGISEVIVTTLSAAGKPNAAPIGIITTVDETGAREHSVKLYRGSQTLANVLETGTLAANVTTDAVLFVRTAFEDLPAAYFTAFEGVPVLWEANAWTVFTAALQEERKEYLQFRLTPQAVKINRAEVKAINRGLNAVIEATVLATRLSMAEDERAREEMRNELERYAAIVEKCGGRREKEAGEVFQRRTGLVLYIHSVRVQPEGRANGEERSR
jgi:hypothetical protein